MWDTRIDNGAFEFPFDLEESIVSSYATAWVILGDLKEAIQQRYLPLFSVLPPLYL